MNKLKAGVSPWLPFREPKACAEAYQDPRLILRSRVFYAIVLVILQKAVCGHILEDVVALVVYLLDQSVTISDKRNDKVRPPIFFQSFFSAV